MRIDLKVHKYFDAMHRIVALSVGLVAISFLSACALQPTSHQPLQLVSGSAPVYPAKLKSAGVSGLVTVAYDASEEGKVGNLRVIGSEPPGLFDAAALRAVASWQFKPQIRNGVAEPVLGLTSKLEFRAP